MVLEYQIFELVLELKPVYTENLKADVRKINRYLKDESSFGFIRHLQTRTSEKNQLVEMKFKTICCDAFDCIEEIKDELEYASDETGTSLICVQIQMIPLPKPEGFDDAVKDMQSKSEAKSSRAVRTLIEMLDTAKQGSNTTISLNSSAATDSLSTENLPICHFEGCSRLLLDKTTKLCWEHS